MEGDKKNYQAQVLRGEKWFNLMTAKELAAEPENSSKPGDVEVYKESCQKVKEAKAEEKRNKGNK